ncbi:MAG: outer membrane lipoprotein-sorting protein [Roseimicrobium sp.]
MSLPSAGIAFALSLLLLPGTIHGADKPSEVRKAETLPPTGEEILRLVRMSQALQDLKHLKGKLRIDESDLDPRYEGSEYPFDLTMADNVIRFMFPDPPKEIINLDLNDNGTKLTRVTSAGKIEMPASLYGERVRQTAINYEDLSMRFLYWPNAKVIDEESISFQTCWVVRVSNPDNRGPYRVVDLWVHRKSGAMMQLKAYNAQGKIVKIFEVRKAQKYSKTDSYILKQMRVETFDPETNKVLGRTYLEIADPD